MTPDPDPLAPLLAAVRDAFFYRAARIAEVARLIEANTQASFRFARERVDDLVRKRFEELRRNREGALCESDRPWPVWRLRARRRFLGAGTRLPITGRQGDIHGDLHL